MKPADIIGVVKRHEDGWEGENNNYRSWELCFRHFCSRSRGRDLDCLQLAAYLASFGMYRGSGFIASKDYLVHEDAVAAVGEYCGRLQNLDLSGCIDKIDLVFSLGEQLTSAYKERANGRLASETLVTKIMMGTLGCAPAYDSYFRKGLRGHSLPQAFSREALKKMLCFCKRESAALEKAQLYLNQRTRFVDYPIMRVIDIYFWQRGYETDRATPPSPRATF
jgi:hypothetical protein